MSEYMARKLKTVARVLGLIACLALVIVGQRQPGWGGLGIMMIGLAGILALLYAYNRRMVKAGRNKTDSIGETHHEQQGKTHHPH